MQRCVDDKGVENPSAGIYRLSLAVMNEDEPFNLQIIGHPPVWINPGEPTARVIDESPTIPSDGSPVEAELCQHELHWLETAIPGTTYKKNWQIKLEKIS